MKYDDVYLECGEGWKPIIRSMLKKIEDTNIPVVFDQIKEKFGELRVYYHIEDGEYDCSVIDKIIEEAEKLTSKTCEMCGDPGELDSSKNWISVVCEKHK